MLALALLGLGACAAASPAPAGETPRAHSSAVVTGESDASDVRAEAWPEADALFHADPRWLGADAALSVDLGDERTLWLFGDTFVAQDPKSPERARAVLVRNSIAVQRGTHPATASITFHWGLDATGAARSFFPEEGGTWFWPGHGIRSGRALTLILHSIERTGSGALDFRSTGWRAVRIDDVDAEPSAWRPRPLATPDTRAHGIAGASLVADGAHVYAFGVREPGDHAVWLMRWTEEAFAAGDLSRPEYWGGESRGFGAHAPATLLDNGATEFSVVRTRGASDWMQVQSHPFGRAGSAAGTITLRTAPTLTGPWTPPRVMYAPPDAARSGVLCYAGKAHPQLRGADLVVTYACNDTNFASVLSDPTIYYPRFVRVTLGDR
jgi:hypothetical protein